MPEPSSEGRVAYCTNVHPGSSLEEMLGELATHSVEVRRLRGRDDLPVGLWLSSQTVREVIEQGRRKELRDRLDALGLQVVTLNGFPWGNFHAGRVKHSVYRPDWWDDRRLAYTVDLAAILARLLPAGSQGSISTLPLGWRDPHRPSALDHAAQRLVALAAELEHLEETSGCHIHVDLEPEPGCVLDTSGDVVDFFYGFLWPMGGRERIARYLGVCHDVCHGAVMFEDQSEALARYREAGIRVGKVQISSAPRVDFERLDPAGRRRAWARLQELREDRYLHQTVIRDHGGVTLFEDLPDALEAAKGEPRGEWRVHFHVPIDLEEVGDLGTTREEIDRCLEALAELPYAVPLEVETYAWGVLPDDLRTATLAEGIARELRWIDSRLTLRERAA